MAILTAKQSKNDPNEGFTIFNNGKMFGGVRKPHKISSYKNKYGVVVDFRKIPLYNEKGEPSFVGGNTEGKREVYGQPINFSGQNSVRLHNKIHKDVIEALIEYPHTVSSSYPKRKHGTVIKYEPGIAKKAKEAEVNTTLLVFKRLNQLLANENKNSFDLVCAALDIKAVIKNDKIVALTGLVQKKVGAKMFLALLEENEPEIKKDQKYPAIVKMAIDRGILVNGADLIWRLKGTDIELGTNSAEIHSRHEDKMSGIIDAMNQAGYLVSEKVIKKPVAPSGDETGKDN